MFEFKVLTGYQALFLFIIGGLMLVGLLGENYFEWWLKEKELKLKEKELERLTKETITQMDKCKSRDELDRLFWPLHISKLPHDSPYRAEINSYYEWKLKELERKAQA
jgi:hypothetical protein